MTDQSEWQGKLFKVRVRIGWRNQITGQENKFEAGEIISFEEGDFHFRALQSFEGIIERRLVERWDSEKAQDTTTWSRDELLQFLKGRGEQYENLEHNEHRDDLIPLVDAELAKDTEAEEEGEDA